MPKKKPAAKRLKVVRDVPIADKSAKSVGALALKRPSKKPKPVIYPEREETWNPADGIVDEGPDVLQPSKPARCSRAVFAYCTPPDIEARTTRLDA